MAEGTVLFDSRRQVAGLCVDFHEGVSFSPVSREGFGSNPQLFILADGSGLAFQGPQGAPHLPRVGTEVQLTGKVAPGPLARLQQHLPGLTVRLRPCGSLSGVGPRKCT